MVSGVDRRQFLAAGVGTGLALTLGAPSIAASKATLSPITGGVIPIDAAERRSRILKLQQAMRAQGISAMLIEPSASLVYFTGIKWGRSERLTAAIIPADGEIGIVTPYFEEPTIRQMLALPVQVRTWQEDENPLTYVADWLRQMKADKVIGIEETMRYFIVDSLANALPHAAIHSGAGAVRGVRMIKSPAELALMQTASDVTIAAYRHTARQIARGMTPDDIAAIMNRATTELGGTPDFALILLGEASANPHGSNKPQLVRDGEIVLMDCGCTVEGYCSDISRTSTFGEPSKQQRQVWNQVHRGQEIALDAAKPGASAGGVDDAVRAYYESLGYGPRFKLPGLSHRTGHGIGLGGHEPVYLVHGESTPLAPGMCFSNEPGIYIPGSFGIRLEDCFHVTESGSRWFSRPPASIDQPYA
jgi:Xaa-Pro dipeptidase